MARKNDFEDIPGGVMCRPDTTPWYDQALTRTGG